MREHGFGFYILPDPTIQAFDNIGRIDDFPDFQRIVEELSEIFPVVLPRPDSISIFVVPLLLEVIQSRLSSFQGEKGLGNSVT